MMADKTIFGWDANSVTESNVKSSMLERRIIDWLPAVALFIFVAYRGIRDTVSSVVGMYGLVVGVLTCAAYFLLAVYWLMGGLKLNRRFLIMPVFIFFVFIFYTVLRGIDRFIFDEYALPQALSPMGGMVAFLFLASQNDANRAETALKFATVVMTVFLQSSLSEVMQMTAVAGYDMGLGFDALFFALLSLHFMLDGKGTKRSLPMILWAVCAISNVALILSYGSRGPLLGLVAFAALRFLVYVFSTKVSASRKFLISVVVIGGAVFLLLSLNDLAFALNSQLNSMGISSRTLEKFLYSDFMSDSGRSKIWGALIPQITVFGNGPFADQAYLGIGNYCHNFIFEVFYDFGVLFGFLILWVLAVVVVKAFRSYGVSPWFPLFLALLSFCIGRLALSGTFWTETYFWGLLAVLGLCIDDLGREAKLHKEDEANS